MNKMLLITIGLAVAIVATLLLSHLVTVDHFQQVYGLSFGSNNKYCYLDLDRWHSIVWGCESAR
jgi:hypothetical protein